MSEFIAIVAVLAVVLAIVAVAGHGIWLFVAFLFSAGRDSEAAKTKPQPGEACPRCQTIFRADDASCAVCLWPDTLPRGERRLNAVLAVRRQLYQYRRLGLVSEETFNRLIASIDETARPADEALVQAVAVAAQDTAASPAAESVETPPVEAEVIDAELVDAAIVSEPVAATVEAAPLKPQSSPLDPQPSILRPQAAPAPRGFGGLLAAFLEEKHIRWGELVGGMLIVCCSIALVISFWSEIAARPLLKFCVFNGVSAAIFAAGLYSHARWNLHTTSRGLLIVAILLVPLNFLAIAAFTNESPPTDMLSVGGEAASLALFSVLCYFAGRVLTPDGPWLLAAGVLFPSLMQLLTRRYADTDVSTPLLYALAAAPLASYVAAMGTAVGRAGTGGSRIADGGAAENAARESLSETTANRLFILLGILTFAAVLPLGLLLFKTGAIEPTLQRIAPLAVLAGLPALSTGMLLWRRVTDSQLVREQTAGTTVGVIGAMTMASGMLLAWPDPRTLLVAALLNAAAFLLVALWFAVPQAHVLVAACSMVATLVAYHVAAGNVAWDGSANALQTTTPLESALLSAASGNVLAGFAAACVGVAFVFRRRERLPDALWWMISAGLAATFSIALVAVFGFGREGDPHGATWTLALYAAALAAASFKIERQWIAWTASTLLLAALVQGVVFRYGEALAIASPWTVAFLLHATVAAAVAASRHREIDAAVRPLGGRNLAGMQWLRSAMTTSIGAAVLLAAPPWDFLQFTLAAHVAWLAIVWLAIAVVAVEPRWFAAFQTAAGVAVFLAVVAVVGRQDWYQTADYPWFDPWFLQAQGVALAGYCLVWSLLRIAAARLARRQQLSNGDGGAAPPGWLARWNALAEPRWLAFDRLLEGGLLAAMLALSIYAAAPHAAQELAPLDRPGLETRVVPRIEQFAFSAMPVEHTAGVGAWALFAAVVILLAVGLWESRARWRGIGLLFAGAAVCPLAAAWFADGVSVASALRWLLAGYVVVASIPIWLRTPLARLSARCGIDIGRVEPRSNALVPFVPTAATAFYTLLAIFVGSYLAMIGYVAAAVLVKAGVPAELFTLLRALAILAFVSTLIALLIRLSDRGVVADVQPGDALAENAGSRHAPALLLFLGVGPLFMMCSFLVAIGMRQHPLVGPEPGDWFRTIGWSISYGTPLALFALTLVGHAIRERSSRIYFSASLLLNAIATVVYLLELARLGRPLDASAWIEAGQVNAIACAAMALAWVVALGWRRANDGSDSASTVAAAGCPTLLTTQVLMAAVLWALPMLVAVVGLAWEPRVWPWVAAAGGPIGWAAAAVVIATIAAWSACATRPGERGALSHVITGPALAALVAFIALALAPYDDGRWLAFHALLAGVCVVAWAMPLVAARLWSLADQGELPNQQTWSVEPAAVGWSSSFAGIGVALALRAFDGDPAAPWWTLAALGSTTVLAVVHAWMAARRAFLWVAGVLLPLATSIWWIDIGHDYIKAESGTASVLHFLYVNILAAGVAAIVSAVVERQRIAPPPPSALPPLSFQRFASWACLAALVLLAAFGLARDADAHPVHANLALTVATLVAVAATVLACLWDSAARFVVPRLWWLGFVAVLMLLDARDLVGDAFLTTTTVFVAGYALAASLAWNQRDQFESLAAHFGVPLKRSLATMPASASLSGNGHGWMVAANAALAAFVTIAVYFIGVHVADMGERTVTAMGLLCVAGACALVASGAVREPLQVAALGIGVLFAIALGWARLPLDIEAPLLHRAVVAAVAMAGVIPLFAIAIAKLVPESSGWPRSARRVVPILTAAACIVLIAVLGLEVHYFAIERAVPLRWPAVAAVLAALVTLALAALAAAVLPGRDPFALSERGRTAYVYAAEILLALAFMHVRLTMPWLFTGWFTRFWPLVVVAIAFLGVGFAELCRRRRIPVLSEPLENTGALLPLLPTIGFWTLRSEVNYSLLLLSVAALYSALSVLRKSFLFGMLAAVAANGSLWYWLYATQGIGLWEHPQLWLIPPALCVLAGAYMNRSRLSDDQMTAIRYLSAIVIYASSTADVFLNGVGEAPWLPVALAGLSLVGIFAGILLRVRAFLYLGTCFLMVALFTVIWHAAVEQDRTWIWWVTGIVTGAAIIALFGLFEKKRDDMLRLIERVKAWDA